jgi:hypothetical protein
MINGATGNPLFARYRAIVNKTGSGRSPDPKGHPTSKKNTAYMRFHMSIAARKIEVLHILSQNLKNPQPQLVRSSDIANQLNLSLSDTQLLLKVMNDMGIIEINVDNQLSLITQKGLHYLNSQTTH